jgi:NAD(P)-dependent dehydrogenase (short-subunit alcohol dehydrogenase family)
MTGICLCFVKRAADLGANVLLADVKLTDEAQKLVDGSKNIVFQKTDVTNW